MMSRVAPLRRLHVHLAAEDIGGPLSDYSNIVTAAKAKFSEGGWWVLDDATHDIDIDYDGRRYIVEAWVT